VPIVIGKGPDPVKPTGGLARLRSRLADARLPLRRAAPAAFSAQTSSPPRRAAPGLAGRKSASSFIRRLRP